MYIHDIHFSKKQFTGQDFQIQYVLIRTTHLK